MRKHLILTTLSTLLILGPALACSDDEPDDPSSAGARGGTAGASTGGTGVGDAGQGGSGAVALGGTGLAGGPANGGETGQSGAGTSEGGAGGGADAGAAGAGGAGEGGAPPAATVVLDPAASTLLSAADQSARALYFFGGDLPASATTPAVSSCAGACLTTWPVFHQPDLVPGEGLSSADFGELLRDDGARQTTFHGWPLYTYAADDEPGERGGDGVESLWHAAEEPFYTLVVMRGSYDGQDTGPYLADGGGRTIYRFIGDQAGTATTDPVSTCTTAGCRKAWPVVAPPLVHAVGALSAGFEVFIRPETGALQLAYGGYPIYYFVQDIAPGAMTGLEKPSWALMTLEAP